VGGSLYLLANYYSVVHESIQARIKDAEGDLNDKKSLGSRLAKIRVKVFTKQVLMLINLQAFAGFQKFEIPIGGRFPKEQYGVLVRSILTYVPISVCYACIVLTFAQHNTLHVSSLLLISVTSGRFAA
jgi:hypothetical protein